MVEYHASCQCGQLRVTAQAAPDVVVVCNCHACQKRSGSPFGEAGYFPKSAILIEGRSGEFTRTADSGRRLTNHFCPECGTNVYWSLELRPDHLGVAAGCFDAPLPRPARVVWTEAKHDWVAFPEDMTSFARGTPEK